MMKHEMDDKATTSSTIPSLWGEALLSALSTRSVFGGEPLHRTRSQRIRGRIGEWLRELATRIDGRYW